MFDFDLGDGVGLVECVEVVKLVCLLLCGMGFDLFLVISGSKGIYLYVVFDGL